MLIYFLPLTINTFSIHLVIDSCIPSEWRPLPGRHEAEHESYGVDFLESVKKKTRYLIYLFIPTKYFRRWVYSNLSLGDFSKKNLHHSRMLIKLG